MNERKEEKWSPTAADRKCTCTNKPTSSPSQIRQVPDNQEVYLDQDGFTSIVFDILERVDVGEQNSDLDALKYHLSDIVEEDDTTTATAARTYSTNNAVFNKLP